MTLVEVNQATYSLVVLDFNTIVVKTNLVNNCASNKSGFSRAQLIQISKQMPRGEHLYKGGGEYDYI